MAWSSIRRVHSEGFCTKEVQREAFSAVMGRWNLGPMLWGVGYWVHEWRASVGCLGERYWVEKARRVSRSVTMPSMHQNLVLERGPDVEVDSCFLACVSRNVVAILSCWACGIPTVERSSWLYLARIISEERPGSAGNFSTWSELNMMHVWRCFVRSMKSWDKFRASSKLFVEAIGD
jgi:hypothetical protein